MRRTWLEKGQESFKTGRKTTPGGPAVESKFISGAISTCAEWKTVKI